LRGEKGEGVKVGIKVLMDSVDNVSIYSNSSTGKTFSWNLIWWEMYIHLEKKKIKTLITQVRGSIFERHKE